MNTILLVLFIVIVVIVIAQIMKIQDNKNKPLLLGIVLGLIGTIIYYNLFNSNKKKDLYYNLDLNKICGEACKREQKLNDENTSKNDTNNDDTPLFKYNDDGSNETFPLTFKNKIPKYEDDDIKVSNSNYDIDGKLINGNTINPKSNYNDQYWKMQELNKLSGDDIYTAANLHFSRKPREAFYYQSRWGVNSLRPWLAAELNSHSNKIWWEDNPDLDQYM
jgi:hypothetical protein